MALKTNAEMAEITQNAIVAVLEGGQAYTAFGRSVTRADLPALRKELSKFTADAARDENGGGIQSRRAIPYR